MNLHDIALHGIHFSTRQRLSGQLHAQSLCLRGNNLWHPLDNMLGGSQNLFRCGGQENGTAAQPVASHIMHLTDQLILSLLTSFGNCATNLDSRYNNFSLHVETCLTSHNSSSYCEAHELRLAILHSNKSPLLRKLIFLFCFRSRCKQIWQHSN